VLFDLHGRSSSLRFILRALDRRPGNAKPGPEAGRAHILVEEKTQAAISHSTIAFCDGLLR